MRRQNACLRTVGRGNVRELKNVIEYLDSLGKRLIEKEDLPASIFAAPVQRISAVSTKRAAKEDRGSDFRDVVFGWWNDRELIANILLALLEAAESGRKIGRRQLETVFAAKKVSSTQKRRSELVSVNCRDWVLSDRSTEGAAAPFCRKERNF